MSQSRHIGQKNKISKQEFKNILLNYAEKMILKHKRSTRHKHLDQINFKLHGDSRFKDKNEFFEF